MLDGSLNLYWLTDIVENWLTCNLLHLLELFVGLGGLGLLEALGAQKVSVVIAKELMTVVTKDVGVVVVRLHLLRFSC